MSSFLTGLAGEIELLGIVGSLMLHGHCPAVIGFSNENIFVNIDRLVVDCFTIFIIIIKNISYQHVASCGSLESDSKIRLLHLLLQGRIRL